MQMCHRLAAWGTNLPEWSGRLHIEGTMEPWTIVAMRRPLRVSEAACLCTAQMETSIAAVAWRNAREAELLPRLQPERDSWTCA